MKGDDALHRAMMMIFEREGMRVIGPAEAARGLLAAHGPVGRLEPSEDHDADILHGIRVALTLGALDVGQAAVVCQGLVLAVEAAEGTDAMLVRVASLPEALRGSADNRRGVLVKAAKPHQERRIDLPAIGVRTVELAANAGLSGIAIEGGGALIVGRNAVASAADRLGVFVYGFAQEDYPRE
jgi:UDP-2,3-diacylglucosamine hydrolase